MGAKLTVGATDPDTAAVVEPTTLGERDAETVDEGASDCVLPPDELNATEGEARSVDDTEDVADAHDVRDDDTGPLAVSVADGVCEDDGHCDADALPVDDGGTESVGDDDGQVDTVPVWLVVGHTDALGEELEAPVLLGHSDELGGELGESELRCDLEPCVLPD